MTEPSRWRQAFQRSSGTLTGRAALSVASGLLDYVARIGVTFLLMPLMLATLGSFGFGLWQVLRQMIGYANPATGQQSQVLKWKIASLQASADLAEKRRMAGAALSVSIVLLPVLLALGGLIAWQAPIWTDAPPEMVQAVRWVVLLLIGHLALTNFAQIPQSVLIGENLAYRLMGVSAATTIGGGVLMALSLRADLGLVGLAMSLVAVATVTGVWTVRVCRRSVEWFGLSRPNRTDLLEFFGLSGWFLGNRAVVQALRASDMVVLGLAGSVEMVSGFTIMRYLPEALATVVGIGVFSSIPGLGQIMGRKEWGRAAMLRSELHALTWLVMTVSGVLIILWNRDFIGLWIGDDSTYAGDLETLLILAMAMQLAFIRNDSNFINLTLEMREKVLLGAAAAGVSLFAGSVLVLQGWGVVGLCLGFCAGRAILNVAYPRIIGRQLEIGFASQLRGSVRPLAVTVLLFGLALAIAPSFEARSWLSLIGSVVVSGPIVLLVSGQLGLAAGTRGRIVQRLASSWGRMGGSRGGG